MAHVSPNIFFLYTSVNFLSDYKSHPGCETAPNEAEGDVEGTPFPPGSLPPRQTARETVDSRWLARLGPTPAAVVNASKADQDRTDTGVNLKLLICLVSKLCQRLLCGPVDLIN